MNKIDYHSFFEYVWEDESLNDIISMRFIEDESDFIRELTLEIHRQYELRPDVSPSLLKKLIEIFITKLAIFQPKLHKIKPLSDKSRDVF